MKILWSLVLFLMSKEVFSQNRRNAKTLTKRSPLPDGDTSHTIIVKDISEVNRPLTDEMKLVLLNHPLITCNDGSSAGYYFREVKRKRRWLIFLQGGYFCFSKKSCDERYNTHRHLMSSTVWPLTQKGTGILSAQPEENPHWWNANVVFIPYCSSDVWIGMQPRSQPDDYNFLGSLIIQEVLKDLPRKRINRAKVVMLAGKSAGGIGVLMNIDRVAAILEQMGAENVKVRGLVDAGWFLDLPPITPPTCTDSIQCSAVEAAKQGLSFWNAALPESCRSQFSELDEWQCYLGHKLYPSLKAPVFLVQYLFDRDQLLALNFQSGFHSLTGTDLKHIQNAGRQVIASMSNIPGVFAPSCVSHGLITNSNWQDLKIEGISVASALRCWEKSLRQNTEDPDCPFHLIDKCPWPHCNPGCPALRDPISGKEVNIVEILQKMGINVQKKALELELD